MGVLRRAMIQLGLLVAGLGLAFAIMAHDMPHVYPGLSDLRAFFSEKAQAGPPELSDLQQLRERSATLPEEAQGLGAPIGGGTTYGILDVFRMKQVFRDNDRPTMALRTRPGQSGYGPKLPYVGETRKSNNSLLGMP